MLPYEKALTILWTAIGTWAFRDFIRFLSGKRGL